MIIISNDLLNIEFNLNIEDDLLKTEIYHYFSGFNISKQIDANNTYNNTLTVTLEDNEFILLYSNTYFKTSNIKEIMGQIIHIVICYFIKELEPLLILHGAAIAFDDSVICFVGKSRSGKSTITSFFLENYVNAFYITDDIIIVEQNGNIVPFPKPIYLRDVELWETINNYKYKGSFVFDGIERFWYIPKKSYAIKQKITRIILLNRLESNIFHYTKLTGKSAYKALLFNLHNSNINLPIITNNIKNILSNIEIGELYYKDIISDINLK